MLRRRRAVTDSGWDIPGVSRGASAGEAPGGAGSSANPGLLRGPGSSAGPGSSGRATKAAGRSRPSASVSASAGSSAGAFATSAASPAPPASSPDRPLSDATLGSSQPGGSAAGDRVPGEDGLQAADPVRGAGDAAGGAGVSGARRCRGTGPTGLQADCLRALAVAESRQTAAHAKVLAAFSVPGGGLAGDGHRSPRVWLSGQTQASRGAADRQVARMRPAGPPAGRRRAGGRALSLSLAGRSPTGPTCCRPRTGTAPT